MQQPTAPLLYHRSPPRGPFRWGLVLAAAALALPGTVSAQALADPLVPRGRLRLDFVPSVSSWDSRYGLRADGASVVEEEEALGSDFTDPRGVSLFPGVATLEESIRALSGDGSFEAVLGQADGRLAKEVTRLDMGLRVGVTDWLTVGVNVPYVRGRTTLDFAFVPGADANLGINPAFAGSANVGTLLDGLGTAAVAAQLRANGICSAGGGAACESATALSRQANDFWSGLLKAYFATPFFPLGTSQAAGQMQAALASLDAALRAASLPRVGTTLPFATKAVDAETLQGIPGDPAMGIAGSPLEGSEGLWQVGDMELNATVRLLEGERREEDAVAPRFAYGLYGGFLLRLGTGQLDDPNVFLDIGSGDGQMDMEGRLDALLRVGQRLSFRGGFRYGMQQSVDILRRVAPHEAILPLLSTTRAVTWTPGDYTLLEVSPRLHLGEALTLAADFRRFHKGEDGYELLVAAPEGDGEQPAEPDPVDLSLLSRETEMTLQEVSVGLRYSSLGLWRQGRVGTPAELGLRVVRPISGSGGQTPKATRFEFSVSLFRRIWG